MLPFIAAIEHFDATKPLDLGHAVPTRKNQSEWKPLLGRERLTVECECQDRFGVERVLHVHAAAVRRHELATAGLGLLFGLHVETQEDDFTSLRLEADLFEQGRQADAGPHTVAEESTHALRTGGVPGALEGHGHVSTVGPRLQLIERELARAFDEAANAQAKRRGIDALSGRLMKRVVLIVGRGPRRQRPQIEAANGGV